MITVSARPHKCDYPGCDRAYKRKTHLNRHIRHAHSFLKYECPISGCNQSFKRDDYLATHLKYVHNFKESKRISCPYPDCNESFKRKGDLNEHIRFLHHDVPRLTCPYPDCNKTYQRKSSLNEHIRFFHLDVRPHVCKICGEPYRQLYLLRYHLEHDLCRQNLGELRAKYTEEHHIAVNQLYNFIRETKMPKSIYTEITLPNGRRLDLLLYCPDDRFIGFDTTIGRSTIPSLRRSIMKKYVRDYEQFCDIVYIVAISSIDNALQTIRKCDRSPFKPKKTRVVHWNAIIQEDPKFFPIFQQIEDGTFF